MPKSRRRGPTLAKDINRRLVYKTIKQKVRTSRVEVARALHLNKNTVNAIVGELAEAGFVRDIGRQSASGAGRKPIVIEFHAANKWAIGAQLTSTAIHWAVTDLYARPHETFSTPLDRSDPEGVIGVLADRIGLLTDKYGPAGCIGLCLGIPGLLETGAAPVIQSSHLNWRDVPLPAMLEERLSLPVLLDHSVKLASLGELWHGQGQGVDHFIYCNFGNGVGCSLILNGAVVRGAANLAGELGHFVIDPHGPVCGCGNRGCLEASVGIPGFLRSASERLSPGGESPVTLDWMLAELARHNETVREQFEQAARSIGQALSYVANLLNPRLIICDGPLMQASDWMFPVIRTELRQKCLPATYGKIRLVRSGLYPWTSCIGAAATVIQRWEDAADVYA